MVDGELTKVQMISVIWLLKDMIYGELAKTF